MERKRPRLACTTFAQHRKLFQQLKGAFDFIDKVIGCYERAFADILVNGGIGVGLCVFAKTDSRHFLRQELLREVGT